MTRTVAIVGGGLAGIAAAVRLAEAGHRPLVLESRRKLGGRATSFIDPRTSETLDNCQHVLMGCCTNLIDLYERVGVLDKIQWHRTIHWAVPRGRPDRMTPGPLPVPGHFAISFLRMRLFDIHDKIAVARVMWRLIRLGSAGRVQWRERTFGEFLLWCRQTPELVAKFWQPIVVSACNLPVERVGASFAMQVFQDGFIGNRWASAMGLATVPLIALYDPAEAMIEANGGAVRLGVSVRAIAYDGQRVSGVVTDDGFVPAAAIIAAVPPERLDRMISSPMRAADARLRRLNEFTFSPILGVHLRFETRVLELPHLVLPGRGTQWLFDKGVDREGRQHVHAVISAADEWMELDEATIVQRVLADIHACVPRSKGLQPIEARSVKEKRATFAALPGVDALRPHAAAGTLGGGVAGGRGAASAGGPGAARPGGRGGLRNLFLAGDWCDTGWPATMEGAVRSGYAAAEAMTETSCVIEDLPTAWLASLLGLR